ncbi:VOC family protein [Streptomonospora nanhaiensis]|uniref:Catechol 2,3-dioxygenase-like lactoylglutathione lyase family enzyme n=1 Tax=Streptomonospora nanhaiensis TaxID=1323731 RepID=A0A853BHK9_9ACTN|nr:VOC family protein [Streptomonospora nanhaiensis]MBV2366397.1 VOC family protein [Streptomonospora nanhaiensis]MBX9390409.1 VOC family protein [Streptomonospora nanhaiensis]NYI94214.1 catechol 2,3-dioxygenase-like lactoylglutathione lyase family enzyme [Streptomonospora nanhaiensis]
MVNVLSSRVLLHPRDLAASRAFYRDVLGLAVFREFGTPPDHGTVFFLGGGFLEVSGTGEPAADPAALRLWLQVPDIAQAYAELAERGAPILRSPRREPWGLVEMWTADPDGVKLCVVEVPADHPMRYRP